MKALRSHIRAALLAAVVYATGAHAQTNHYVSPAGGNSPPYLTWGTAATTIQAAIDASGTNDVIWVTNGIYQTGGVTNYPAGALTNRVAIYKPVVVRSVNGPSKTAIRGAWHPGTTNGPAAVRCVYMVAGAELHGFTITNGATLTTGDNNNEQSGGGIRCASTSAIISNCVITWNSGNQNGAGIHSGTVYDSDIAYNANRGGYGGGAYYANLHRCRVYENRCSVYGGGMYGYSASECVFYNNYAGYGGGTRAATVYNSTIYNNTAGTGGGAEYCHLYNCLVEGNTGGTGGGAWNQGTFTTNYNCTIIGNLGSTAGGVGSHDVNGLVLINCIVRDNWPNNWYDARPALRYCNSSPLPAGEGNIDVDPMFIEAGSGYGISRVFGNSRLAIGSPCVNMGTNFPWQASDPAGRGRDKDLDGQPRLRGQVDMGAYEQYIAPGTIFFIRGAQ